MNESLDDSFMDVIDPVSMKAGWNGVSPFVERKVFRLFTAVRRGRRFILKTLREPYAGNPAYEGLLEKEATLGMRLDHPGIVRVEGLEEVDGVGRCLVMEMVDGQTLLSFIDGQNHRNRKDRAL